MFYDCEFVDCYVYDCVVLNYIFDTRMLDGCVVLFDLRYIICNRVFDEFLIYPFYTKRYGGVRHTVC